jgi:hypothetical protein
VSSKRFLTAVAWSTGAISLAGFAAAWFLAVRNGNAFDISAEFGPDRFMIAYAVAGTILASRRPANPVGWFLLGIGLVTAVRGLAGEYALADPSHHGAVWAAWYVGWSLILLFPAGLLASLLLLFPDGRPLTRRWWAAFWGAAAVAASLLVITWLDPAPIKVGGLPNVPNPTGVSSLSHLQYGVLGNGIWAFSLVFLLLAVVSVVLRYRRSAGEERLQLKWFAYAAAVSLGLIFALLPVQPTGMAGQVVYDMAIVTGIGLALPVAIGTAVLKYRLYAIDKIISRTVSYALVTGLVVGVYLGCVALLTRVLPVRGGVGVAVSVLAAAALFNPLRRRVQGAVDRRFNRARYDAERVVTQFSVQLRDQVDLDVLGDGLLGVVDQVLAPAHLSLWLREPGSFG